MAMPRRSFSCTAGLHELGKPTLPTRSADWAKAASGTQSARTASGSFIDILPFVEIRPIAYLARHPVSQWQAVLYCARRHMARVHVPEKNMIRTIQIALAGAIIAASCAAATAQTLRVRGTIEKADGNVLTLKS